MKPRSLPLLIVLPLLISRPLPAATIGIVGNTADYELRENGTAAGNTPTTARAGATFATPGGLNAILIFSLPALPAGSTINRATLTFTYASKSGTPSFQADLWGLGFFTSTTPLTNRYLESTTDANSASTKLQSSLVTPSSPTGLITSADFSSYIQSFYTANPGYSGGSYVFLRLNPTANPGNTGIGYNINTANSPAQPVLTIATASSGDSTLDTVTFGSTSSEQTHALTAASSSVISGALGQAARQLLPLTPNAINGGQLEFLMTVDPAKRNYFTLKLWGSDDTDEDKGRLYLYVPVSGTNYQVGYRHEGDYLPLSVASDRQSLPGRFFYTTTLLPLWMTQGKTALTVKVISTGRLYAFGTGDENSGGNYQFNMKVPSRGIYAAYTHTSAILTPAGEVQGSAPASATRPSPTETQVLGPSGSFTTGVNNYVTNKLNASLTALSATDVMLLARSYSVSQLTAGYQNAAVVSKVITALDGFATDYYANPTASVSTNNYGGAGGNEVWGGRFGALGWAVHLLLPQLQSTLDTTANYGTGGTKTRRQAWGDMLIASRDYGRFSRDSRYLTNQSLIANDNIYKANRGALDLGDSRAFAETAAQRYLREAIGLTPWLGSDLTGGGSSRKYGGAYNQVTQKGLTREWGYVGTAYGEMQYFAASFYRMTGNTEFRDQAAKMIRARAPFRRPALELSGTSTYYKSMEGIGLLAWRGASESDGDFANAMAYAGSATWSLGLHAAAATLDPYAVGYAKQMLADNQYFAQLVADNRYYNGGSVTYDARYMMEVFADYQAIKNAADSGIRLPMTAGQPDFAWADEENGIIALKQGDNRLWLETFWQAKTGTGVNSAGRFHYSTPAYDQYGTLAATPQFTFSGTYFIRPSDRIDKPEGNGYVPPDAPVQAYGGEQLPLAAAPADAVDRTPFQGRASFSSCRFGKFLIGINSSGTGSYTLATPAGFSGAKDLVSGQYKTGTVSVPPLATVILDLADAPSPAPQLVSATSRKTHGTAGAFDLGLAVSGATGVESRAGTDVTLVFTFDKPVISGLAGVAAGAAQLTSAPAFSGSTMTVSLSNVADRQSLTIDLVDILGQDAGGSYTGQFSFRVLAGDVNGSGSVTASDLGLVKTQQSQPVTSENFRSDINTNGTLTTTDVGLVKSVQGASVP